MHLTKKACTYIMYRITNIRAFSLVQYHELIFHQPKTINIDVIRGNKKLKPERPCPEKLLAVWAMIIPPWTVGVSSQSKLSILRSATQYVINFSTRIPIFVDVTTDELYMLSDQAFENITRRLNKAILYH